MAQKASFKELINSDTPTLIDFTAAWCGPCKAMAPVLQQVAGKVGDKGRIIKIDVDQNRNLATKMNVRGVPTFIMFKNGEALWRESGMQSAQTLENLFNQHA